MLSVDNIQMVDRCSHDAEILAGIHVDYRTARAFVHAKLGRASHYVITTFFHPPLRKQRTTLVPSLLRPEILAAEPEPGDHLLVYGRISEASIAALEASGVPCHVYGARDGLTAEVRGAESRLPAVRERGVHRRPAHRARGRRLRRATRS